jgi:phosphoglycerate dehydrogenase-like enzyme
MRERTAFPATLIRRLPKLRMISITGASVATLDVAACARQGVIVRNTAGGGPGAPYAAVELALGLLIAAARAIPAADSTMRAGGFQHGVPTGMGLAGKTLGIIGLGRCALSATLLLVRARTNSSGVDPVVPHRSLCEWSAAQRIFATAAAADTTCAPAGVSSPVHAVASAK